MDPRINFVAVPVISKPMEERRAVYQRTTFRFLKKTKRTMAKRRGKTLQRNTYCARESKAGKSMVGKSMVKSNLRYVAYSSFNNYYDVGNGKGGLVSCIDKLAIRR